MKKSIILAIFLLAINLFLMNRAYSQSKPESMRFLNCTWEISPEMTVKALKEALKVSVVPVYEKSESDREMDKLMGVNKLGLDKFELRVIDFCNFDFILSIRHLKGRE